ncbi:uncharacterized protein A4U43_C01F370 [Asparagus officinalis]|uniref:Leucine-rich repeat-containing N-terminal plant-type domain-containing protein n=1 Tax=Asparagus officinalis TaxID=4686 RepID=A0A5P1FKF9_ASPOF|nr:uncharacterized protein A4U43_C01F370 [Asparagus officinalis]
MRPVRGGRYPPRVQIRIERRRRKEKWKPYTSWQAGSNPCSSDNGHSTWARRVLHGGKVWALQLERMRLSGQLNVTAARGLPGLRAALYLSNNRFSGDIPDAAFSGTRSLKKVYLSNNGFTGKIPSSLTKLSKLMFLRLDDNQFEGQIPDLAQPGLKLLNVSFNKLEGSIPLTLNSMMDQSLFAGSTTPIASLIII